MPRSNLHLDGHNALPEDEEIDRSLRPKTLVDYVGQNSVKEKLSI
ncbi:MAG TPA: Holliday junction branch migration DNA helicase RuvB, partial [Deltaproteobacteria bacterium]|nr:Holliday junction branch migration DNA helicase RuvB [Deltaproteobacteria bacterium]